ncbi:ABC transporter permease [Geobacillus subterraneus]|uniref:ABC transporter permease n=2 Tax=Geobacillus TaxID=129337 RepID=A0ABM6ABM9_9BACL|nr:MULTISPECIES: ABC transporter permease [Geobacillus]AMX83671.1 ABC transporter permease [Geobacillus subterraneus]KZS24581.1 ABC transporter permease [Geobacillus subterraneus]OXB87886.1 ABC transporter permease [Geobacillus uzenensis]QIZ67716.1 ABC transporter permease [Geobacillus subterraneus]
MSKLVYNEMLKIVRKKRLWVIAAIVAVLVALFTYAQYREAEELKKRLGTTDWRTQLQQQIVDLQNRLQSPSMSEEWRKYLQIRLKQQQYYLEHDINPSAPGAPTFMRIFIENAIDLFLPLLVMVVAADLVSSEASAGTIKLLLVRPVKRWKVLLSKYIALLLSVSFIMLTAAVLSYVISGLVFGYGGFHLPLLTGFVPQGEDLDTTNVHMIPQWKYVLIELGLAAFVSVVVGTLTFMLSVLLRSTAAVMGIMLAALISGAILSNMVSSWHSAKYLFMVNLRLTDYIKGTAPPVEGMTLGFSMAVLAVWGLIALIVAFVVFTRRDVY